MIIRLTRPEDIPALNRVVDETELFPVEMLAGMVSGFLSEGGSEDVWLTCEVKGTAIGFCYAIPEALTEGTWNMLAIAVLPPKQGGGVGSAIVTELENSLREHGQRLLIVETSGTDDFASTRAFYSNNGYAEEARIRDFWSPGADKVVFSKAL